jgi:hypothetical protein
VARACTTLPDARMLTRRHWLTSIAGLGALALTGLPRLAHAAPKKVLLVGDSMIAGGFGLFLARALESQDGCVVDRRGKSSTGLARPDFHDWIAEGAKAYAEFQPDAVVCMFGGNDGQGLYMGRKADPEWIRWEEPAWTPEYRRRVNEFADAVTPKGEHLMWIGMPQMRLDKLHQRVKHMNQVFRAEMAIRPKALFVDIWRVLANDQGEYADKIEVGGKKIRVRTGDGVHLTTEGCHHLVRHVRPEIQLELGLATGS